MTVVIVLDVLLYDEIVRNRLMLRVDDPLMDMLSRVLCCFDIADVK